MGFRFSLATSFWLVIGCAPTAPDFCETVAASCGAPNAPNWIAWCRSECVPEHARTVACGLNAQCILCDAPRTDGNTIYFALPSDELEYMWTLTDPEREPIHPATEPAPTGSAFVDGASDWSGEGTVGAWHAYDPFPGLHPYAPEGFCEPGPNRFVADGVVGTPGAMVMNAQRMPTTSMDAFTPPYCPASGCLSGPYEACDAAPTGCQYGEDPDIHGLGTSNQADRFGASGMETYGYGHFRSTFKASGDDITPEPGFVYAFFTQGNEPCVDGAPNVETNSSELDIEVTSGPGESGGQPYCTEDEMCFELSTWVSSTQGIDDGSGVERHQVSGFRFRDAHTAAQYRTYGFDWQPTDVRFTYDRDPHDCDEQAGGCSASTASLALCQHLRFIPRRPAPLHFQLWNAWWAGDVPRGTQAQMSVERVWHEPSR